MDSYMRYMLNSYLNEIKTLRCEIRAVEQFLKQSSCVTYEDINANLSKVYRDSLVTNSVSSSEKAATWKKEMEKYNESVYKYWLNNYIIMYPLEDLHLCQFVEIVKK